MYTNIRPKITKLLNRRLEFSILVLFITLCFDVRTQEMVDSLDFDSTSTHKIVQTNRGFELSKPTLEAPVNYNARDSIVVDLENDMISLYGEAFVKYQSMTINAGMIQMNLKTSIVTATFVLDSIGQPTEKPVFNDDEQEMIADTILYNFETKKGKVKKVYTQEGEGYIQMGVSTIEPNKEIHMIHGKYSTCSLEEPHFHFNMSKAVLVPEKRIVSGPMNLVVAGIPTPIGLPFALIPFPEKRSHGIIPSLLQFDPNAGIGLVNLGYYIPLGDNWQTTFYGTIWTKGNWGVRNVTDYRKRYSYNGTFGLEYFQRRFVFPENGIESQTLNLKWIHSLDAKANPYWRFNANIDFRTDNNSKNSIDLINDNYLKSTLKSDIKFSRTFKTNPAMSLEGNIGALQNSITEKTDFILPSLGFNVNRWLFLEKVKSKDGGTNKWYHGIGLNYNMSAINTVSIADSTFEQRDFSRITDNLKSGIQHNIGINTTAKLGKQKLISLVPSISYRQYWNFQYSDKYMDMSDSSLVIDTITGFGFSQYLSTSLRLQSNLYGMYSYKDKNKSKILHTLTPILAVSYVPEIGNWDSYKNYDNEDVFYSPFSSSAKSQSYQTSAGYIDLSFQNKFELKTKTKKDTTSEMFSKFILLDNFSVSSRYDLLADTFNLDNIVFSLNANPTKWLSLNSNTRYTTYGWDKETGRPINQWAWNTNRRLGRVENSNFSVRFIFAPKEAKQRVQEIQKFYGDDYDSELYYLLQNRNHYVDFAVPWNFSLTYNFNLSRFSGVSDSLVFRHAITFNGDFNLTPNWKVIFNSGFDVKAKVFTYTKISIMRDLHCWKFMLDWIPFGPQQGFVFTFSPTASLLQDLKLKRTRPPIGF
jgi:hypothetical protein